MHLLLFYNVENLPYSYNPTQVCDQLTLPPIGNCGTRSGGDDVRPSLRVLTRPSTLSISPLLRAAVLIKTQVT